LGDEGRARLESILWFAEQHEANPEVSEANFFGLLG